MKECFRMTRGVSSGVLVLLFCATLLGQENGSAPAAQGPLTNASIVKLVKAGIGDTVITSMINKQPGTYSLGPDDIIALRSDGVSDAVISAMLSKSGSPAVAAPAAATTWPVAGKHGYARTGMSRVTLFTGYSEANVDTNGLTPRLWSPGWTSSVNVKLVDFLSVEGEGGGYYPRYRFAYHGVPLKINGNDYSIMTGPRLDYGPAFFHVLFGADRLSGKLGTQVADATVSAPLGSQTSFAMAVGGGGQIHLTRYLGLRLGADWTRTTHNIVSATGGYSQNNVRLSLGLVYYLGGLGPRVMARREARPMPHAASVEAAAPLETGYVTALGLLGYETADGFKVTAVHEGSPAAKAYIQAGDVVTKINGKPVKTAKEIDGGCHGSEVTVTGLTATALGSVVFERQVNLDN